MQARVDSVISKVRATPRWNSIIYLFGTVQVREHHQEYVQGGSNTRDIVIVAHGHFNRVCVARWLNFPLHFGETMVHDPSTWLTRHPRNAI